MNIKGFIIVVCLVILGACSMIFYHSPERLASKAKYIPEFFNLTKTYFDTDNPGFCIDDIYSQGRKFEDFGSAGYLIDIRSMMYEIANIKVYADDLNLAESHHTKNENYIKTAKSLRKFDFGKDVIIKLSNCINNPTNFLRHISSLLNKELIANDDYSIAILRI
jgi:hypothetical protein